MTVVCDTSPLYYLIEIDLIDVLPGLFGQLTIPQAVRDELMAEGARVRAWMVRPPTWLDIQPVTLPSDVLLERLYLGEREAIGFAESLGAELLVLDDLDARRIAAVRGLKVTGLLGVLYQAGIRGAIDFPDAIARLRQTSFRASSHLFEQFLEQYYGSRETE